MKKLSIALIALLLVAAVALMAGCSNEVKEDPTVTTAAEVKITNFKAGVWESDGKAYMIFEDDGKSGEVVDATGFEYELDEDGSAVFHMGYLEDNTYATVKFSDEENATISWDGGITVSMTYAGQPGATSFKAGQWAKDGEVFMIFEDGASGEFVDGAPFSYELKENGAAVFHMGSIDDETKATVKFTDEDNATIAWEGGDEIAITYAGELEVTEPTTEETTETTKATEAKKAITKFKAGQWTSNGVVYVFDKDGKSGEIIDSVGFFYEINKDGSAVFHMGSIDDETKATVKFTDEENATITWKTGGSVKLKYAGKYTAPEEEKKTSDVSALIGNWTNDEGKFTAKMTVTNSNGKPYFEVEWQENSALTYVYRFLCDEGKDGKYSYTDGFKGYIDIDADHVETKKILDEEAKGTVELNSKGNIVWTEADDEKNPHIFVKKD